MISFRPMKREDIPAGLYLCRAAGWNQRARDWELFLQLSPHGCLVALDSGGQVVGTVTTLRYQDHFSWVGMVLVDPSMQRQGIGMRLLEESLKILRDEQTVKLDATPAGREVYLKLNFVDEYPLRRMYLAAVVPGRLPFSDARPMVKNDVTRLLEFDHKVFGANRQSMLEWMFDGAWQYGLVVEVKDAIKGYCFGRCGHNFEHIGPVIADSHQVAIHLASAALHNCPDRPVVIDALHHSSEWAQWLAAVGFIEQRSLMRMVRGSNSWPGIPEKQFAILGPEFG